MSGSDQDMNALVPRDVHGWTSVAEDMDVRERPQVGLRKKVAPTMAGFCLSRQISICLIQRPTVIQSKH